MLRYALIAFAALGVTACTVDMDDNPDVALAPVAVQPAPAPVVVEQPARTTIIERDEDVRVVR